MNGSIPAGGPVRGLHVQPAKPPDSPAGFSSWFSIPFAVALVVWCVVALAVEQDASRADVGRHIANGAVVLHGTWAERWAVLHTNFYSYTEPTRPFINHHWLSGVVYYLIHSVWGFEGISALYVGSIALALWFAYRTADKPGARSYLIAFAPVAAAFVTMRAEARPESFSVLLAAFFYWLLARWRDARFAARRLWLLPALMLLWVNLHIGFVFGFVILGAFAIDEWAAGRDWRLLAKLGGACGVAALMNPNTIWGALYPLNIFQHYGYLVLENLPVNEWLRVTGFSGVDLAYFLGLPVIVLVSFLLRWFFGARPFPWGSLLLCLAVGVLAASTTRNLPICALLSIPPVVDNLRSGLGRWERKAPRIGQTAAIVFAAATAYAILLPVVQARSREFGLGLKPKNEAAGLFLSENKIPGPYFNNFDVGSYLVYYLHPMGEKVFIDSRAEAYSEDFFEYTYRPMQDRPQVWRREDDKRHFNAIVFNTGDRTPWGQIFLQDRLSDPQWALVFGDAYNVVFLRRGGASQDLIDRAGDIRQRRR